MRFIVTIIFFLSLTNSIAYEIQGQFKSLKNESEITEGESFDSYIRVWPIPNEDLELFKSELEQKDFLSFFYIAKVYSIKYSENNEEVLEIHAKAILKKSYTPREFYIWNYKSLTIPFSFENIDPQENEGGKEFIVVNQSFNDFLKERSIYLYIVFVVFSIPIGFILGRKVYIRSKINKEKRMRDDHWNQVFQNAQTRKDLEDIYLKREEWVNHLGGETPPILHFFDSIAKIQYKKEWSDFEQLQVNDSFDELRRMFERN
ncbi:hypothetical protein [Halobacteriovorax sp. HLS]|uniref:hypothetical protein n=1 Tax=Halobacteriovorax sp. HLS TaxID=2234000 RepID=UPI000FDC8BE5|nr:hypothetical protein [Halobacteriovorax sp. HLS]